VGKQSLVSLLGFAVFALALIGFASPANAVDCTDGNCGPSPYGAYCALSSYPSRVPVGGQSEITVRYFNTFYPVGFSAVNCGNGVVMYAWNCGGRTGECFTQCRYNAPGAFTLTAFAGGVSCRPTVVYAGNAAPSPTPTPTATPRPTPTPTPRYRYQSCAVETNPEYVYGSGVSNIKIPYYDLERAPSQATVICGNGEIVYGSCEGSADQGNCVASCAYGVPLRYPWAYSVDAVVGGVQCAAGGVSLLEGGQTPTPTARPTRGTLVVKVFREDGVRPFWGAIVRVPSRGDFRTGYDGLIEVAELDEGSYALVVSADGYQTQRVSARVRGGETTRITVIMREPPSPTPTPTITPTPTVTAQPNGALLVRVTNCENGAAVRGARVDLYKQTVPRETLKGTYYTNEFGEALASDLPAGDYVAVVSKEGFETQRASGRVESGRTNTLAVCLEPSDGNGDAHCAVTIAPSELGVNQAGSVTVNYYSFTADPESVVVNCGNGAATTAQCNGHVNGACVGGSCSYASNGVYSLSATSAHVQCAGATARVTENGGTGALSLQALETDKQGYGGEKTCFALLLRNSGDAHAVVELDAAVSPSNDWEKSFSSKKFVVVPHEIKNVDFCVDVPEGESGSYDYLINARSEINDAVASVSLRAFGSADFSLDYGSCMSVEADSGWATRVVRLTNNAADGNYEVELGSNELGAEADAVYAFKKGETRDVVLRFSTEGLENRNYYFDFNLKKNGAVVFQRALCVRPSGAGTGAVTLSPTSLVIARGATQTAVVRVKNTGSGSARFYVSALKKSGLSVVVSPQYLTLDAGSEGTIEIRVTADGGAVLGAVSVPVRVYNSAEYGYYGGGYYGDYSVDFDCGDGETRSAQCGYGDGSCSVSCVYENVGTYTPRAALHGNSCSSQVRVLDYYPSNSLVLRAETPFIAGSGSTNIRIDYYSLGGSGGNAPVISQVYIDPSDTSAEISWRTDELADSRVDYALASGGSVRTVSNNAYVTSHAIILSGLNPNTQYVFNVTSCDQDGHCATDGVYELETQPGLSFASLENAQNALYFDDSRTIRVDCGNGEHPAVSCSGSTGSCSVSCYYSSTGTYSVTASVDGASPSVYATRVVVGSTSSEACYLTNDPQTIRDGESSAVKMNYYRVPNDGYNGYGYYEYGYGGLVDSQTLLVTIVATQPEPQGGPLITQNLEIDAKNIRASPGSRTFAPVTIRNKNYYDIASLLVYADSLPSGVTAKTPSPFAIAAGEEKTVALEFDVGDAAQGDYEIVLHAESAVAQAPVKRVTLQVRGAIGEAAAGVSDPATSVKRDDANKRFEITLSFNVKNEAGEAKTLSAAIEGLPEGWTYGMAPAGGATLASNETRNYTATIFAPLAAFDETKEYPATLAISDETGKTKRVPLAINKGGASVLAGFFTALGGDYGLLALLVIVIATGAALLYFADVKTKQAQEARDAKETKEAKEAKARETGKKTKTGKSKGNEKEKETEND